MLCVWLYTIYVNAFIMHKDLQIQLNWIWIAKTWSMCVCLCVYHSPGFLDLISFKPIFFFAIQFYFIIHSTYGIMVYHLVHLNYVCIDDIHTNIYSRTNKYGQFEERIETVNHFSSVFCFFFFFYLISSFCS